MIDDRDPAGLPGENRAQASDTVEYETRVLRGRPQRSPLSAETRANRGYWLDAGDGGMPPVGPPSESGLRSGTRAGDTRNRQRSGRSRRYLGIAAALVVIAGLVIVITSLFVWWLWRRANAVPRSST